MQLSVACCQSVNLSIFGIIPILLSQNTITTGLVCFFLISHDIGVTITILISLALHVANPGHGSHIYTRDPQWKDEKKEKVRKSVEKEKKNCSKTAESRDGQPPCDSFPPSVSYCPHYSHSLLSRTHSLSAGLPYPFPEKKNLSKVFLSPH